jgi:hypothetical protein
MPLPRRGYPPFFVILPGPEAACPPHHHTREDETFTPLLSNFEMFYRVNGAPSPRERRPLSL